MILWSQQIKEIGNVFYSFQKGERLDVPISNETQEKNKIFLNPSKYESMTIGNFKILLLYQIYNKAPTSLIKFLNILNSLTPLEIKESNKFKSEIMSYDFILKRDLDKLKALNITPYDAFLGKLIHIFTLNYYYKKNSSEVNGRLMKIEIKRLNVLMSYFKLKEFDEHLSNIV